MDNVEKAIMMFIEKMEYPKDENVIGIVFYGSYLTGYNHKDSDIDLHIIKLKSDQIIRGVKIIEGFKVEYFEKSLKEMYLSVETEFNNQSNALLSIIGKGKIIFDRNNLTLTLKNYINGKYSNPIPCLASDDAKEMVCILENRMLKIRSAYKNGQPEFEYFYHLLIEKIRKFYHRLNGLPEVPVDKAARIYKDYNYRVSFCRELIPDLEFINLYMKLINNTGSREEKIMLLENFYNYAINQVKIDTNNYRILIKSRNNPNNRNHE
ncbi:MAG: nucleotidyltransferase domain-containing protein [Bacilli bacterium]|nr:nucleotidyltransferase domain-containing protein [Bacilli bacterium]